MITSLIPVRFNAMPSRASTVPISSIEWPCARSSMIRARAASLPGAVFGPGRGSAKKSRAPPVGPEVAHRRVQARGGVAEALRDRGGGLAVQQVGPQRLVPPLRARFRGREVLPTGPGRPDGHHRGFRGIR